jgi:hypothetical protein
MVERGPRAGAGVFETSAARRAKLFASFPGARADQRFVLINLLYHANIAMRAETPLVVCDRCKADDLTPFCYCFAVITLFSSLLFPSSFRH